jgi:hypothetical protein
VTGSTGNDTVTNSGDITGAINLGTGTNKVTNTTPGTIGGAVAFSTNSDSLVNSGSIGTWSISAPATIPSAAPAVAP